MTFLDRSSTGAIILAGGASKRMGKPKALLRLGDETFVDRLIRVFVERFDPVVVVVGHNAEKIAAGSKRSHQARWILNPKPEQGQFSSLQCGLTALPRDHFCFCPVDIPAFQESTVDALWNSYIWPDRIRYYCRPTYKGRGGHPVIADGCIRRAFLEARPDSSAKAILKEFEHDDVPVDDPAILSDVDEPGDYERLIAAWPTDE